MDTQVRIPLIFHARRGAAIALCVGILLELRDLRYLFEVYVPGPQSWLTHYHFTPTTFDLFLHIWCSVVFVGALIFVLRRTGGGERIYIVIFLFVGILGPISDIPRFGSMHLVAWIAAITELGLIPSALWMYRTLPARRAPTANTEA
jgi:hypothetical protein